MTLIFGVNLSDRVYLAADTRITHRGSGRHKDNLLKLARLSDTMAVATAGDALLARFVVRKLKAWDVRNDDVHAFRRDVVGVVQEWLADYVLHDGGGRHASCCLVFGGRTRVARKRIVGKEVIRRVAEFQEYLGRYTPITPSATRIMTKPLLMQAMMRTKHRPSPVLELECADTHLFALLIDTAPTGGVVVEDTEWGEYLAYGGGLKKDAISGEAFGRLEFQGGHWEGDYALLCAFIQETARENSVGTIGGAVAAAMVQNDVGIIVGVETYRTDPQGQQCTGEVRQKEDGSLVAVTTTGVEVPMEPLPRLIDESGRLTLLEPTGVKTPMVAIEDYAGFDGMALDDAAAL